LTYARGKEKDLYESLINLTNSKQAEIQRFILQAIDDEQERIADKACSLDLPGNRFESMHHVYRIRRILSGIELTDQLTVKTARDLEKCTSVIQDFVLVELNKTLVECLTSSVSILQEDYIGTLTRCLKNLERIQDDDESGFSASEALREVHLFSRSAVAAHIRSVVHRSFVDCSTIVIRIDSNTLKLSYSLNQHIYHRTNTCRLNTYLYLRLLIRFFNRRIK
jgi:hypothetical protein